VVPGLTASGLKVGRGPVQVAGLAPALSVSGSKVGAGAVAIGAQTSVTARGGTATVQPGAVRIAAAASVAVHGTKRASGAVHVASYSQVRVNSFTPTVITPIPLVLDLSPIALVLVADREALTLNLSERLTLVLEA
jgi:hypothetical protein